MEKQQSMKEEKTSEESQQWHIKAVEKLFFFFKKCMRAYQGSQEMVCDVDCVSQCKMQQKQTHCAN